MAQSPPKPQENFPQYLFNAEGYCIATASPRSSPFLLEDSVKEILKKIGPNLMPSQDTRAPVDRHLTAQIFGRNVINLLNMGRKKKPSLNLV